MSTGNLYDMVMETEEYITPEEYIARQQRGEINPADVRYADCDPKTGRMGGFWVKLKQPRYRIPEMAPLKEARLAS